MDPAPDSTSPYLGIHSFRFADRRLFFGRGAEIGELLAKILLHRMVVLFGETGTGKTSLVAAGLVERLRREGLSVERIRVRPTRETPFEIRPFEADRLRPSCTFLPTMFQPDDTSSASVSLSAETFKLTVHKSRGEYPVLIFDQFEELFTLFGEGDDPAEQIALQQQILDLMFDLASDEALRAKVVIVIREDFLGKLEALSKRYPTALHYRVRLLPLTTVSATNAILLKTESAKTESATNAIPCPFKEFGLPSRLTPALAARIVHDLAARREGLIGGVAPTQLQIVCDRLWRTYAGQLANIDVPQYADDPPRGLGGVTEIISEFFRDELNAAGANKRGEFLAILGGLITSHGTRDVVSQDRLLKAVDAGMRKQREAALTVLEERRIVSRTPQRGTYLVELASEYLVPPIHQEVTRYEREQAQVAAEGAAAAARARLWKRVGIAGLVAMVLGGLLTREYFQQRDRAENEQRFREKLAVLEHTQSQKVALLTMQLEELRKLLSQADTSNLRELRRTIERANRDLAQTPVLPTPQPPMQESQVELQNLRNEKAAWERERSATYTEISSLHEQLSGANKSSVDLQRQIGDLQARIAALKLAPEQLPGGTSTPNVTPPPIAPRPIGLVAQSLFVPQRSTLPLFVPPFHGSVAVVLGDVDDDGTMVGIYAPKAVTFPANRRLDDDDIQTALRGNCLALVERLTPKADAVGSVQAFTFPFGGTVFELRAKRLQSILGANYLVFDISATTQPIESLKPGIGCR